MTKYANPTIYGDVVVEFVLPDAPFIVPEGSMAESLPVVEAPVASGLGTLLEVVVVVGPARSELVASGTPLLVELAGALGWSSGAGMEVPLFDFAGLSTKGGVVGGVIVSEDPGC